MALIFDRREGLTGRDMTHALLVGVSEYRFLPGDAPPDPESFGLKRLSSPALSAHCLAHWLIENRDSLHRPLGTCRLIFAPSAPEMAELPQFPEVEGVTGTPAGDAGWTNFVAELRGWRRDASLSRGDGTFFYYSGHGLQRLGATILTLADFADPGAGGILMRSVELSNIVGGMAPGGAYPSMARNQAYFIDSCREPIDAAALQTTTGSVFDPVSGFDDRTAPVFQATYPGSVAQSDNVRPTDFCKALIRGLERGAEYFDPADARRRWPVTVTTLHTAISNYFTGLSTGQLAPLGGTLARDEPLVWLTRAPAVDLSILIDPDAAIDVVNVSLAGPVNRNLTARRADHPYALELLAGTYDLEAGDAGNVFRQFAERAAVNQRTPRWTVPMQLS